MRFTRPGARPRQDALEGTKLRGSVLGSSVEDEGAGAKFRAGEVLQLVPGAIRWIELDVEMVMAAAAARGLLMHGHHIRKRLIEQPVVLLQQALEGHRKRQVVFLIQVEQTTAVVRRCEVDLVRPPRERRHKSDPALIAQDGAHSALLALDDIAVEAAPRFAYVLRFGGELTLQDGWNKWIRIDLSVWMAQRDSDLLAAILEDIDISHVGQPAQLVCAVAPHLDQVADVIDALRTQRRVVVGRI